MILRISPIYILATSASLCAADSTPVGEGSFANQLPDGAKGPPSEIYRTEKVIGPVPTNDWWSSLVWEKLSSPHYPHPLFGQSGARRARRPTTYRACTATRWRWSPRCRAWRTATW
ncbi:MAG: hypothetical protein R3F11_18885 [Verrucomicrobiales bacterium]